MQSNRVKNQFFFFFKLRVTPMIKTQLQFLNKTYTENLSIKKIFFCERQRVSEKYKTER